jgi:hypothetical protein
MPTDDSALIARLTVLVDSLTAENERLRTENAALVVNDAHALLRATYNNLELPLYQRLDAAKAAIKFEKPAPSAAPDPIGHKLAERVKAARQRVQTIDHEPAQIAQAAQPAVN